MVIDREAAIKRLREDVEKRFGKKLAAPNDFVEFLAQLDPKAHGAMSLSTIKRLWGYVPGYKSVRDNTLSVLARYLGYNDWDDYIAKSSDWMQMPALALSELSEGDCVELTWNPNRRVVVVFMGCNEFVVKESENAKLQAGDRFECLGFVNGEQLVLTRVKRRNVELGTYVCGKRGGVKAEKIALQG